MPKKKNRPPANSERTARGGPTPADDAPASEGAGAQGGTTPHEGVERDSSSGTSPTGAPPAAAVEPAPRATSRGRRSPRRFRGRLFEAIGRLSVRRPRLVLALSGLVLTISAVMIARGGALSTGETRGTEADLARRIVDEELHLPGMSSFVIVFSSDSLETEDPRFTDAMRSALAPLRRDPHIARVIAPDDAPDVIAGQLMSLDYHRAMAVVTLREPYREAIRFYPDLREKVRSDVLDVRFTGHLAFRSDLDSSLEKDLIVAEAISIPLALLILLLVFRTFVSASLPVGVGGLAVAAGMAGIMAISLVADIPSYSINVVSLIGLGVAIDYSLFIVSRYRDALAEGESYDDALVLAVSTAGRAVAFSGLAVGVGLSGLIFFQGSFLAGMGVAGAIVVLLAVAFALTFLPALLKVLGPRIHAGRVPFTRREGAPREGGWRTLATWVMRHPLLVLVPTLGLLLTLGLPFLHLRMAQVDITVLPRESEARSTWHVLQEQFPDQAANRILVVARFPSSPALTRPRALALYDLAQRIRAMPDVRDVQSVADLGPMFDRESTALLAETPLEELSDEVRFGRETTVGRSVVVLTVLTDAAPASDAARALVARLREQRTVADGRILVTGQTADDMDVTGFILERAPYAVAFVVLMTILVLLVLLRSIVLPLKAVAMNFLSIAASFGALVWIFQDGHFAGLLRFEAGPIEPALPVLLFCSVFGLSMDYEVLMLTRMQEEYAKDGDNTRAVAEGLERSGSLVTSAAAIMVGVFVAFSFATMLMVKAMGVGMALAVTLDATLVRVLIVPATMRLFGDVNWWAPSWLKRMLPRIH